MTVSAIQTWADALVRTKTPLLDARTVFQAELVRLAHASTGRSESKTAALLGVHRVTVMRTPRLAAVKRLSPEAQTAVRHLAELIFADVRNYHKASDRFDRQIAEAALRRVPRNTMGKPIKIEAAKLLGVHRNALLAILRRGGEA